MTLQENELPVRRRRRGRTGSTRRYSLLAFREARKLAKKNADKSRVEYTEKTIRDPTLVYYEAVPRIRKLHEQNVPDDEIAAIFNVTIHVVRVLTNQCRET